MEVELANLIGVSPASLLIHGPTKLLVDAYHWHVPEVGIVASYSPTSFDVNDHFGIFRGVDMVESFAQAVNASCGLFMEIKKQKHTIAILKADFTPLFLSIGQVNFIDYLEEGEVMICMGRIKFYKFRQMICDGRIYKVPKGLDLNAYFENYTTEDFLAYHLPSAFVQVADLKDITGRMMRKDKL